MKWYSTSVPVADHGDHCCRESIKFTSGGGAFVGGAGRPFCVAADWRHYGGASEDHSRFRDELASGREASKQQRHFSLGASGFPLHASMSMRSWSRCWSPPPLPPLEGRSCRASQGLKGKMDGLPHPSFLPRLCPPTPHNPWLYNNSWWVTRQSCPLYYSPHITLTIFSSCSSVVLMW